MTHRIGFSRRELLITGGVMLVGFQLGSRGALAQIQTGSIPAYLLGAPAVGSDVDSWIVIHTNNTVTAYFGRGEFGQGTLTGMLQVAAEELDLDLTQISAIPLDTARTRNQGSQVSSSSIEGAAPSLRAAAAEARQALLKLAAARLDASEADLRVSAGVISAASRPGRSVTYGELIGDKRFDIKVTGTAPLKPVKAYKLVGMRVPRVDIPAKMNGTYEYVQHVRLPGMLHGRVVRPAGQGALGTGAKFRSVDETSIALITGARVVRKGDFLGVVAADEWSAVKGAAQLKVDWELPRTLSGTDRLHDRMKTSKTADKVVLDVGDAGAAMSGAVYKASGSFKGPYESHAPFAPHCALADVCAESAEVICATQNLFPTRAGIARVLKMPVEQVRVRYVESSGSFGHSCYDDAAQAAAILSQAVGQPVRVQFSRADELGWDHYGPAHLAEVRAAADANGKIVGYEYHGWQHGWNFVVEATEELALNAKIPPSALPDAAHVNKWNAGAMYDIPNRHLVSHAVPGLEGYLKGSYLRSPLDLSISFASEQIIDELAFQAKLDPVEFRKRNISNPRWMGVLEAVAKASEWRPHVAGDRKSGDMLAGTGVGLGTHFVSFGAAVAQIQVNRKTGEIRVLHVYGALDAGLIVNPASVEQQIEGQIIQATSRVLHEEVRFNETSVTSLDWESYPILRFNEAPVVTPIIVSRPDQPSTGAGEEVLAATGAAIANAFFDATGIRMRERPMTRERVLAALGAD